MQLTGKGNVRRKRTFAADERRILQPWNGRADQFALFRLCGRYSGPVRPKSRFRLSRHGKARSFPRKRESRDVAVLVM